MMITSVLSMVLTVSQPELKEFLPGVRADIDARIIEFDGEVAIDVHDPDTPRVYLEQIVCSPDTREHESLIVSEVTPSHLHAALLAVGLEPGSPVRFVQDEDGVWVRRAPSGPAVEISFIVEIDGEDEVVTPESWFEHAPDGERYDAGGWLFTGSRMATRNGIERYDADGAGTIIGLAAFGSEVITPASAFSPDASVAEPVWIADSDAIPERGTAVTVRISVPIEE